MNRMNIMTCVYLKECLEFSGIFDRQDLRQLNTLFFQPWRTLLSLGNPPASSSVPANRPNYWMFLVITFSTTSPFGAQ
jgi:hypothetical protein